MGLPPERSARLTDMAATETPLQWEILRKIPGEDRVRLACRLTDLCFEITRQGIRDWHPDWEPEQVERELRRRLGYRLDAR